MKIQIKTLFFVIVAILLAGCATNWNARVGIYSYNQVVEKMGKPPSSKRNLPSGDTEAKWYGEALVFNGVAMDGSSISQVQSVHYDLFTFDKNGVLKSHKEGWEAPGSGTGQ